MTRYPGNVSGTTNLTAREPLVGRLKDDLFSIRIGEALNPLYLQATVDPESHLTVFARINALPAEPLVDSGATGVFMHPDFAFKCQAIIQLKKVPRKVRVIDGRIINLGRITYEAIVQLQVDGHTEVLTTDLTNTGRYPCILGTP